MVKIFKFSGEKSICFDDQKTVKELLQYAFDEYGYYEPLGMEIVTLFQPHSRTSSGWFTIDTSLKCVDEIVEHEGLCFAYHMPGVFYYAEGGWGHHMSDLGNRPLMANAVLLHLRFEDFNNTVVVNGNYTFNDIVHFLKQNKYVEENVKMLMVRAINPYIESQIISFDSEMMHISLEEFKKRLPDAVIIIDIK